jgi:Protein of unknown function DUF262
MFSVKQHASRALTWWYEQYREEKLDMDPPYQRRSDIWSVWKRAHLIDSILNDFDVPKFYVADFGRIRSSINQKKRPYAIIDGKQRFAAIFEFLSDSLKLNGSSVLDADARIKIGGLSYTELKLRHPILASKIEDFTPVVMSVLTDDQDKIPQLFIRLNSGEAVNRAERRNAMPGSVPRMIADLTVHPFFQRKIRFNKKRMQDFNLAAKFLLLEYKEALVDTKAPDLDRFVEAGIDPTPAEKRLLSITEERAQNALERLSLAFHDNDPLLATQSNIPIYYWAARNKAAAPDRLRRFIEAFTAQLKDNLEVSRDAPEEADAELAAFYTMSRTTNDQASLDGRYKIFTKRLRQFH